LSAYTGCFRSLLADFRIIELLVTHALCHWSTAFGKVLAARSHHNPAYMPKDTMQETNVMRIDYQLLPAMYPRHIGKDNKNKYMRTSYIGSATKQSH
jgi:hypothetical protein